MRRYGIDALEITKEADALAWQDAVTEIDIYYQPTGDTRPTIAMSVAVRPRVIQAE